MISAGKASTASISAVIPANTIPLYRFLACLRMQQRELCAVGCIFMETSMRLRCTMGIMHYLQIAQSNPLTLPVSFNYNT